MLVHRVRELQFANEHERRNIFTAVGNFDKLALEVTDVGFKTVTLPHFDGEEMVIILLGLPTRGILSEECLGYLLEVMEECCGRE